MTTLPYIDEHSRHVTAPPDAVWSALGRAIELLPRVPVRVLTSLLGTKPRAARGNPLTEGATVPGFLVTEAVPGERLVLTGRHRFSEYELIFVLVPDRNGTRLCAQSYARFPGPHGRAYRAMVIGSGGHRIAVGRMLSTIARRAEQDRSRP